MRIGKVARIVTATALVGGLLGVMAPAAVAGNDDVRRRGMCSGSSTWKLKVGTDDGMLDGEYEVDQNVNGQAWRVRLWHDGELFKTVRKTTQAPSGSFEVDFRTPNHSGTDAFRARARNLGTGEICKGSLRF